VWARLTARPVSRGTGSARWERESGHAPIAAVCGLFLVRPVWTSESGYVLYLASRRIITYAVPLLVRLRYSHVSAAGRVSALSDSCDHGTTYSPGPRSPNRIILLPHHSVNVVCSVLIVTRNPSALGANTGTPRRRRTLNHRYPAKTVIMTVANDTT
jgi:hypothetical protein